MKVFSLYKLRFFKCRNKRVTNWQSFLWHKKGIHGDKFCRPLRIHLQQKQ